MIDKTLILDFLKIHRNEMVEEFGVTKIGLFGSYVRDEQKEDSDIDIAVEIESTLKPIAKEAIIKDIIYV